MTLNFLYVADNSYFDLIRVSAISVLKKHKGIIFHIFTMDSPETKQVKISDKNKNKIENEIKLLDPTSRIIFYDVRDVFLKKMESSVNNNSIYTPYSALRLLSPYVIKDVDLVLYLDADTIVTDKLDDLFIEYENQEFDFAAAFSQDAYCFLSTSLLINLRYQRKTNYCFIEEAVRLYNTIKYEFPDQEAITAVNTKKTIILHGRYVQKDYEPDSTKILCVCYRNDMRVKTFLKQSIFRLDAAYIHKNIERIIMLISDIQNSPMSEEK